MRAIKKNEMDNVATVLCHVNQGDVLEIYSEDHKLYKTIKSNSVIPYGHKIALCDIKEDSKIYKQNVFIGVASKNIHEGTLVHVHNVSSKCINFKPEIVNEILRQMNMEVAND